MSFMLHDIIGWKPAIEQILLSARQSTLNLGAIVPLSIQKKRKDGSSMDVLDTEDIEGKSYVFVSYLYGLKKIDK